MVWLPAARLLVANVAYACKARAEMPWGKRVRNELFFNYVLPYATVNERRDDWRKDFYQRFSARARQCGRGMANWSQALRIRQGRS